MNGFHLAILIANELLSRGQINSGIASEPSFSLFLTIVQPIYLGPFRPGIVASAIRRRLGQNLQLNEAVTVMAHRGSNAIGAGIASPDHHHILGGRRDELRSLMAVEQAFGVGMEEFHRKVD